MRARLAFAALVSLAALGACSSSPLPPQPAPRVAASAAAVTSAVAPIPPPPDALRLPASVAPARYAASLTVVPGRARFEGSILIDIRVKEAVPALWLNATELTITRAELVRAGERSPLRVVPGDEDRVGLAADRPIAAGPAAIAITYTGPISAKDDRGIFGESEGGDDYVFTQFEAIDARRAFPCFDEPAAKVPWQLELTVPAALTALSNTPIASESPAPDGMKKVRFRETAPLPSYLVAFAVGPFDVVDAGRAGQKGTPVRLAVPRGRAADVRAAAETTRMVIGGLEEHFGIPYPYDKLDVVAVPQTVSFAAMENAGLITYYEKGMLAKAEEDTPEHQRNYAEIIAHEVAHHWFGDLVTMSFWDDVWLNESFASWMENKMLTRFRPGFSWETKRVHRAAVAMGHDAMESARKVRQPIEGKDDIEGAFDVITYEKGSTLLDMFESWLGPDRFRKGIQRYLADHAHQNAASGDFIAAMSAEVGQDLGPVFASFLDQGGVPLVTADLSCKNGEASVRLHQERFLPRGSKGERGRTWQIPVCMRWEPEGGRACTLLSGPSATFTLPPAKRCPTLFVPNAGGFGYYHVAYAPKDLDALLGKGAKSLTLAERLAALNDVMSLVRSGALPLAEVLERLPALAKDPNPHMRRAVAERLLALPFELVPEALRPAYARFLGATFGKEAHALDLQRKAGEPEEVSSLRSALLALIEGRGDDAALAAEARSLATRWLDDPASVDAASIELVLNIAAGHGDRALFDRLRGALPSATGARRRGQILGALSSFRDPSIARASLEMFLQPDLDPREALPLLEQDERMGAVVFSFVKERYEPLVARLPSDALVFLPGMVARGCDEAHRAAIEAFFQPKIASIAGGPRALAQALEEVSLCIALREAQGEGLRRFLEKK
ncbi:MAG: M1 family aminopeptidase [Byssovorax sp.]